jgi:quercetin dioxygenase-like cupin family protein
MGDVTVKRLDEFDTAYGGVMKRIRAGLGVTSFGIQVFDLPPNLGDAYPEHDHSGDGQEEVYTVLEGALTLIADGEEYELSPGTWIRVAPGVRRKFTTSGQAARLLALGGSPGQAYDVQQWTEEGAEVPVPQ